MSSTSNTVTSSVFAGRMRLFSRGTPFAHMPVAKRATPLANPRASHRSVQGSTAPALPRQNRSVVLRRSITSVPKIAKKKRRVRKSIGQKLMFSMAALVFISGMTVAALQLRTNKEVISQVRQNPKNSVAAAVSQDEPVSEEEPTKAAMAAHRADPSLPRYVRIPSLKVFAQVQRQGIGKNGALKAPGNVHNAGWYENSSKPGEAGAVLLDGHVAGPTKRGVFYNIKNLKAGQTIEIERGDGQKFTYKVVKTVVSKAAQTDMAAAMLSVAAGKGGLNLITCTGQYDHKTGEYDQRLIVFAEQV